MIARVNVSKFSGTGSPRSKSRKTVVVGVIWCAKFKRICFMNFIYFLLIYQFSSVSNYHVFLS